MAFTEQEKIDIRRFCGFPVFGQTDVVVSFTYRYNQAYLTIEYRMNNLTANEEDTVRVKYLAKLYTLETAITDSVNNLDTDQVAIWYHNKDEVADKDALFKLWCTRLYNFFMQMSGPGGQAAPRMIV